MWLRAREWWRARRECRRQRARAHSIFIKACVTVFSLHILIYLLLHFYFSVNDFLLHFFPTLLCFTLPFQILINVKHPKKNDVRCHKTTLKWSASIFSTFFFKKKIEQFFYASMHLVCAKWNSSKRKLFALQHMERHGDSRIDNVKFETEYTTKNNSNNNSHTHAYIFVHQLTLICMLYTLLHVHQQQQHPKMNNKHKWKEINCFFFFFLYVVAFFVEFKAQYFCNLLKNHKKCSSPSNSRIFFFPKKEKSKLESNFIFGISNSSSSSNSIFTTTITTTTTKMTFEQLLLFSSSSSSFRFVRSPLKFSLSVWNIYLIQLASNNKENDATTRLCRCSFFCWLMSFSFLNT